MRRLRPIMEWTVLAAILALLFVTFCAQWQTVVSGSMADTLLGPHFLVTCDDCRYEFACEAAGNPERAVCPNCGYTTQVSGHPYSGSQFFVDRTAFDWRKPRRWEVVVFDSPVAPGSPAVKRIVGLPGETIEARGGDVFAAGQIVRKSLEQARAMAVLVHDTAYSPGHKVPAPSRWVGADESKWRSQRDGFSLPLPPGGGRGEGLKYSPTAPIDWLEYHHWQRQPHHPEKTAEIPIRDDDSYNAEGSRRLNDVFDLLLAARLTATGPGQLIWRITDGRQWFQVMVEPARGCIELSVDGGELLQSVTMPAPLLVRETIVELALIDHRVLFALDGVVHLDYADEADGPQRPTARPIAIGARGLCVQIARLQLFRDVYYTNPPSGAQPSVARLGGDEYFVLGDNSPVSDDSRTWTDSPALRARSLLGKPLGIR